MLQEHNTSLGIMFPVKQEIYCVFEFSGKYEDNIKKYDNKRFVFFLSLLRTRTVRGRVRGRRNENCGKVKRKKWQKREI